MASQGLTTEQCELLQRFYDEELSAAESIRAEQLLERSAPARVFVRALAELSAAVRAGHELAWERAASRIPSPARLAEMAAQAPGMLDAPLDELAALLERFHDGEADEAEAAWVRALLEERADAAAYLAGLDQIAEDLRAAGQVMVDDVDFDGFWDKISAGIDADAGAGVDAERDELPDELPEFDPSEHLLLLHRYADDETDAAEAARVEGWIEQGDPQVREYLAALDEIKLGVTVAAETACEQVALRDIWTGVAEAIDESAAEVAGEDKSGAAPISLENERRKRGGWLGEYRQAIFGAAAAAVVLAGVVGLFQDRIFGPPERVIVEKTIEKRVVIVETVEYSPGSSVMIDSPMTRVNMKADDRQKVNPTVIWLFESDSPTDSQLEDETGVQQPEGGDSEGSEQDAGFPDALGFESAPRGQPI
jgi:hypothetical protein